MNLWKSLEEKLIKSKRKWLPSKDEMPYRCAELFCEKCGKSMGIHDIVCTNLETLMYCSECVKPYIKETPFTIIDGIDVIKDFGNDVVIRYYESDKTVGVQDEYKVCYFNKKGRAIKVKGKKYYI
jgi:tagatose-1,6-bisphosphate aldolase